MFKHIGKVLFSLVVGFYFLFLAEIVNAKVFRNAYISIEVPDSWRCNSEQTEWVCRAGELPAAKEATIIIAAKDRGPQDKMESFINYLNSPITTQNKAGVTLISKKIVGPKLEKINDQQWLNGLHLGSEISQYYTRYFISIKDSIVVLCTLSAHKYFYEKYAHDFFVAIKSLRVIASKNLDVRPQLGSRAIAQIGVPAENSDLLISNLHQEDSNFHANKKRSYKLILLGAIVLGIIVFWRLRV